MAASGTDKKWTVATIFADPVVLAALDARYQSSVRVGGKWRRVANQLIPNAALTSVLWDTEDIDSDGFITPTAATFTVPAGKAGVYAISGNLAFASGGATAFARIIATGLTADYPSNANGLQDGFTAVLPLAVGDTIQIQAFQASGGAVNITGTIYINRVVL